MTLRGLLMILLPSLALGTALIVGTIALVDWIGGVR
jgi:hypothetical protein